MVNKKKNMCLSYLFFFFFLNNIFSFMFLGVLPVFYPCTMYTQYLRWPEEGVSSYEIGVTKLSATMWMLGMPPRSRTRAKMLFTLQLLILSILPHHLTQETRPGWKHTRLLREKVERSPVFAGDWEETRLA